MYNPIMAPRTKITRVGRGLKPKGSAKGVSGKIRVRTVINTVATSRYLPGLLLKKAPCYGLPAL